MRGLKENLMMEIMRQKEVERSEDKFGKTISTRWQVQATLPFISVVCHQGNIE